MAWQAAKPLAGSRTLVRAGHLLDVKTGKILDGQTIVVTGDTISSVAASSAVPAQPGDTVVDLRDEEERDLPGADALPGRLDPRKRICRRSMSRK